MRAVAQRGLAVAVVAVGAWGMFAGWAPDRGDAAPPEVAARESALQAARERARERARRPAFDQPDRALDHFLAQRLPAGMDELPVQRYAQARAHRQRMAQQSLHPVMSKLGSPLWRQSGPDQIGGRTRDLVFDPADAGTMYAAAVSGGVWKSRDGAQSWTQVGHELANLAVVSLVFAPDGRRLLAGTGEGVYVNRPVSRSRGVRGDGIFVSDDGGATWSRLESTAGRDDFDYVNDLVFDTQGRLYAATRTGVHVSDDGGLSFTRRLDPGIVEGCNGLAVSAAAGTVLAACGAHSPGGVWVSADRGANWTRTVAGPDTGRTSLAVAPSQSRIVYALVADPFDYAMRRVLRSDDGGLSWQTRVQRGAGDLAADLLLSNALGVTNDACTEVEFVGGQGWFDNVLAVDPTDPDVVWAGGVDLLRSDDGARSFRFASRWYVEPHADDYVHADQHVIAFHPHYDGVAQTRLFVANDGGVHSTDTPRAATQPSPCASGGIAIRWQARNRGYYATQFYHGDVAADGSLLAGGAQDNGTLVGPALEPGAWRHVYGGDGVFTLFDPRDARVAYFGSQFANLQRTDDGFVTSRDIGSALNLNPRDVLFITPLALDPSRPDVLYTGGRSIFRSRNRGGAWSAISQRGLDPLNGIVSAIGVAPDQSDRIAVGFNTGTVVVSTQAQADAPQWRVATPREGFVSGITLAPQAGAIYATYSTFGGSKVFRSTDDGASWQAIDRRGEPDGLPDVPAHDLLIDPSDASRLLLGTDIGLFIGLEGGARWAADASGLGTVLVERLVTGPRPGGGHRLHAFTYGRGVLSAELPDLPRRSTNPGWGGLWVDPAQDGQGMQIEIVPESSSVIVGWYTHLPADAPRTRGNQLWLTGAAPLQDGAAEVALIRARGRFDAEGSVSEAAGTLRLRFLDCEHAQAEFDLQLDGRQVRGVRALRRLTPDAFCETFRQLGDGALSTLPLPDEAGDFQYGSSGTWYRPETSGQGFLFEYLPASGALAVSWYSYDFTDVAPDGRQAPLWLSAIGPVSGHQAQLEVTLTRGGAIDRTDPVNQTRVGTLSITLADCSTATADYALSIDGQPRSGRIELQRLTPASLCRSR